MKRKSIKSLITLLFACEFSLFLLSVGYSDYEYSKIKKELDVQKHQIDAIEEVIESISVQSKALEEVVVIEESFETVEQQETLEEDVSLSLYEQLTEEEISLIELAVAHEVGNLSLEYKRLIAGCIYNRLISSDFPNDVYEVIVKGQFASDYSNVSIDEETKIAVKEIFSNSEPIHEATYFYNPEYSATRAIDWFENSGDVILLFQYAETSYGITYNTRFFVNA